jgi:tetratricopeptide (TPR) repeat protein
VSSAAVPGGFPPVAAVQDARRYVYAVLPYDSVSFPRRVLCSASTVFLVCVLANPANTQQAPTAERAFQTAVAAYEAGHFQDAATQLEKLVRDLPENFEVHELLGLVYSAQSQDAKAYPNLEKAVLLKPDSVAARTNLASNLVRMGNLDSAEKQFKKAVDLEPQNFDTNHNLATLYVHSGKLAEAVPFLEKAQKIDPSSYDNGYDLSLAYLMTGKLADARRLIQDLLKRKDTAELHNLLGEVEEKDGKFVEAANQYELAAHKDPSESNLFDWGSELLLHRTLDPAVEVFQHASERYPNSPRLMIGLGMALYSRGNYDDAVKALLKGADLNPSDSRCYYFLSKAYDSSPSQAEEVIERFRRFAELQPKNGRAFYYYAMSLWKGRRAQDPDLDLRKIESLLRTSIQLDANIAEAHLQLGNLLSDQNKYAEAIPEYVRARELNPDLPDVYYRLGQAYVRTGDKVRGQEELQTYQKLREQHLADLDKQRAEIRQFVYSEKGDASSKQ